MPHIPATNQCELEVTIVTHDIPHAANEILVSDWPRMQKNAKE